MKQYKYNRHNKTYREVGGFKMHPRFSSMFMLTLVFFFVATTTSMEKPIKIKLAKVIEKHEIKQVVEKAEPPQEMEPKPDFVLVTATYYNSDPSQGEGDGSITADGSKIDTNLLNSGQIRWIAMSRNLLKRFGGVFSFGDEITIDHKDSRVAGVWIVKDCMNERFSNKIDFLIPKGTDFVGKIENLRIKLPN
jgi:3D (Asp-Asp-Asp) domain-containing protein